MDFFARLWPSFVPLHHFLHNDTMAGIANTPQQHPSVSQQLWQQQYALFYRTSMPASYPQPAQVPAPDTQQADLTYQSPTFHAGQHVPPVAQNHQYGYSYDYPQQAP
jgi:hypothetical protein